MSGRERLRRERRDATLTLPRSSTRVRIGVGAVVVLLIAGFAITVAVSLLSGRGQTVTLPGTSTSGSPGAPAADDPAPLYVHVSGAVAVPGVYELGDRDRVIDAIAAAGGFSEVADQRAVNLARFVVDGEQILVPAQGEAPPAGPVGAPAPGATLNLNTASAEQLETLPRVGPALAERIVDWRTQNGGFGSVDDLLNVTGIGEKTLEGFRGLVTV